MKLCLKCKTEKDFSSFAKDKTREDNLYVYCKECVHKIYKSKYIPLKENILWQKALEEGNKRCTSCNKNKLLSDFDKANNRKDGVQSFCKECSRYKQKAYERERKKLDITYKLKHNLRTRFQRSFKKGYKSGSAVRDLGCTMDQLKDWLERQFDSTMSWDNYGRGKNKWNIDHEYPLDLIDLNNRPHLVPVLHYTNLQPMWNIDNRKKSNLLI